MKNYLEKVFKFQGSFDDQPNPETILQKKVDEFNQIITKNKPKYNLNQNIQANIGWLENPDISIGHVEYGHTEWVVQGRMKVVFSIG